MKHVKNLLTHEDFQQMKEERLTAHGVFNDGNILDKYSKFLKAQDWDYFATYTTRGAISLPSARRLMEQYAIHIGCGGTANFSNRMIPGKEYQERHEIPGTGRARLFWAAEPFKLRDSYHLHALVKCDMTREQVDAYWQKKYGFARIKHYDSKRPGAMYCAKYILKTISDYDLHS